MNSNLSPFLRRSVLKEFGLKRGAQRMLLKAQSRGFVSPEELTSFISADDGGSEKITKIIPLLIALGISISIERVYKRKDGGSSYVVSFLEAPTDRRGKPANSEASEKTGETEFIPQFLFDKEDRSDSPPYYRQVLQYPPLEFEEVIRLSKRILARGDIRARNKLVVHNLRLVLKIARWYIGRGLDFDDLVQEGNLGLMEAAERYDGRKGCQFSTYAVWWIRQAIARAVINYATIIRLPVHIFKLKKKVMKTVAGLAQELRREPTVEEIAGHSGIPEDKVRKVLACLQLPIVSLNEIASAEKRDETTLEAYIPDAKLLRPSRALEAKEELAEAVSEVRALLAVLPLIGISKRDQEIFKMRYGLGKDGRENHTQRSVGETFCLTCGRIQQIVNVIWSKLERVGFSFDEDSFFRDIERIRTLEDLVGQEVSFISAPPLVSEELPDKKETKESRNDSEREHSSETRLKIVSLEGLPCEKVLNAVERWSGISRERLLGRGRTLKVALARQVAMYLVREDLGWSFPKIAAMFDGRDHSTVIHNCAMIQALVEDDVSAKKEIEEIRCLYAKEPVDPPKPESVATLCKPTQEPVPELVVLAEDLAKSWGAKIKT